MPGDETRQKTHDESDSESEDEDVVEAIAPVEIDPSKLTPLSPEVISKQVCVMLVGDVLVLIVTVVFV